MSAIGEVKIGRQPDRVHAEIGDVGQTPGDAAQVAHAVAIVVLEAPRVDLVGDRAAPPIVLFHGESPSPKRFGIRTAVDPIVSVAQAPRQAKRGRDGDAEGYLARHLSLSVTQVSRALNDHADVSRATKARVREGARELGYRPNLTARKLKSGRSGIVAMIVPGRSETVEIELLMESVMGLSAEFSRRGLQFVLHVLSDGRTRPRPMRGWSGAGRSTGSW